MNNTRYSNLRRPQLLFDKKPRGLYALLGHLLDKRIMVRYKLSSTLIPECLSEN